MAPEHAIPRALVLASTSRYRAELLGRLCLPFTTADPAIDETPGTDEGPADLVARLARTKARAVAAVFPDALIIGSDQSASHRGRALGKAGDAARARAQLRELSGGTVTFHTGLCLLDTATGTEWLDTIPCTVTFRTLTDAEIAAYVHYDQPFDTAGSFKAEGLGISLFERIETHDPTALIGLPLITLAARLRDAGVPIPPPVPAP
ncbi:MAG: Maf family protein [Pseudomonadota bacterium]